MRDALKDSLRLAVMAGSQNKEAIKSAEAADIRLLQSKREHMTDAADIERCDATIADIRNGKRRYGIHFRPVPQTGT